MRARSDSSVSWSHSSICAAAIARFGKRGLSVPALTFFVSTNFAFANCLASASFANVSVALEWQRFPGSGFLGLTETYQVCFDRSAMESFGSIAKDIDGDPP